MNDNLKNIDLPSLPFPGINPYDYGYRNIFFARNKERQKLIRLIALYRGVLLYSAQGVGKSSLINAGIIYDAIEEGYTPELIRVQPVNSEEIIIQRIETQLGSNEYLPSIFAQEQGDKRIILSTEKFKEIVNQNAEKSRPLLIFDQFEEWVTFFSQDPGHYSSNIKTSKDKIFETIISIINNSTLSVKILLVFREDYLAELTSFFKSCPNLVDQYLRLIPINGEQVYEVIRGPFEHFPQKYPVEIDTDLAKRIKGQFEERSQTNDIRLTEVQIVSLSLYNAALNGEDQNQMFKNLGVKGIIEEYSTELLKELSSTEQETAIALLSRMITSEGTRNSISKENLLSLVEMQEGIKRDLLEITLDKLEKKTPLIRRERRRHIYFYEIASEFLIGWIQSKAKEHEKLLIEKKQIEEKLNLEKQLKDERKLYRKRRNIFVSIIILIVLIGMVITYEFIKWQKEKRLSNARELAAISNSFINKDPEKSILWALQSVLTTYEPDGIVTSEAEDALHRALQISRLKFIINENYPVWKAQFNSDGTKIVTLSSDSVITIWDATSGRSEGGLKDDINRKYKTVGFSISPRDEHLAVSCSDDTVRVWNMETGKIDLKIKCKTYGVHPIRYSITGKFFATVDNNYFVSIWNSNNGIRINKFPYYYTPLVAFNRNDSLLAVSGYTKYRDIRIYNLKSGDVIKQLFGNTYELYSIAFDPKADILASGSRDMTIKLWDCKGKSSSRPLLTLRHSNTVFSVSFSRDGKTLLTGSADRSVKAWDLTFAKGIGQNMEIYTLKGHNDFINFAEFSPDGTQILTASEDKTVRVWSAEPNREDKTLAISENYKKDVLNNTGLIDIQFSPDSIHLASAIKDNVIIWNAITGNRENEIPHKADNIRSIAYNNYGSKIALGDYLGAMIWDLKTNDIKYLNGQKGSVEYVAFSPDGKILATASLDSTVMLWNTAGKNIDTLKDIKSGIKSVAFNPVYKDSNNYQIAVSASNGKIAIEDINITTKKKKIRFMLNNSKRANSIAYSLNGKSLASAGSDGIVTIWDLNNGHEIAKLIGHTDLIWHLAFSHDGKKLVTASFDRTAKVWDLATYRELYTFSGSTKWVRSASFNMDDSKLAVASEDGLIRIYDLRIDDLINLAFDRIYNSLDSNDYKISLGNYNIPESEIALSLFIQGKRAAMKGDTVQATKIFTKAKNLDSKEFKFDPAKEAESLYIAALFDKVKILFKNRMISEAITKLNEIKKINSKYHIDRSDIQNLLNDGRNLAVEGKIEEAINFYNNVKQIDPTFQITAYDWNHLCWWGSLWGKGTNKEILNAGEKAVQLDSTNANFKDSRGVARAENNYYKQAIRDFKSYVEWTTDANEKKLRQEWLVLLQKGKNPFTPELLEQLRKKDLSLYY